MVNIWIYNILWWKYNNAYITIEAHSTTIHLEDSSDDEHHDDYLPPDLIVNERQSLLLGLDQINFPRYMAASPCMFRKHDYKTLV